MAPPADTEVHADVLLPTDLNFARPARAGARSS